MGHLLAMILTAYDPRVNPGADLLWRHASQALDYLVQLTQPADALAATAGYCIKTIGKMQGRHEQEHGKTYRAITASGRLVRVCVDRYA